MLFFLASFAGTTVDDCPGSGVLRKIVIGCAFFNSLTMDADLENLGAALKLSENENNGVVVPLGVWHRESDVEGLFIVGRILSSRSFHPDALKQTLHLSFNPVKGMDFKLLDNNRFLLRFYHPLDYKRVLEGCPWAFQKNLIILHPLAADEHPQQINLD
ncbi:UNVERIFIED_CONTAM: hypothetical protein Sradi_1563600 [Sesamum radiatum]|uniref:DUF4283 domain-containing protein n=1 Tax=Sesamum radiatum TaxID=300843 RepID=A0AAW2U8U6_SESRA